MQVIEPLAEKTCGRGCVILVEEEPGDNILLVSPERNSKANYWLKTERTARRQLERRHALFGEYLRSLYFLNVPINVHLITCLRPWSRSSASALLDLHNSSDDTKAEFNNRPLALRGHVTNASFNPIQTGLFWSICD